MCVLVRNLVACFKKKKSCCGGGVKNAAAAVAERMLLFVSLSFFFPLPWPDLIKCLIALNTAEEEEEVFLPGIRILLSQEKEWVVPPLVNMEEVVGGPKRGVVRVQVLLSLFMLLLLWQLLLLFLVFPLLLH